MTPDALSQEEIDALLKGSGGGGKGPSLTSEQIDSLRKYGNRMAQTQSDMIGTYLGEKVSVKAQGQSGESSDSLADKISGNVVAASFMYDGAMKGKSLLVFSEGDACKIGGTMVGEPEATEASDLIMDAFKEICNTIGGNLNTGLSGEIGKSVNLKDMELQKKEFASEMLEETLGQSDVYGLVTYKLNIESGEPSDCWQIFSADLLKSMDVLIAPPETPPTPSKAPAPAIPQAAPVEFEPLSHETPTTTAPPNLDLLMDIGLEIRVELGRTNMKIRDVLNLGSGSVVELDKLAGEQVDLLVNDVIFAKGEVVVIDENFGVRITEILTLQERIKTLGELKD